MYSADINRSSIREHIPNLNTDQLYDPFRQTLLPGNVQKHAPLTQIASRSSFVSKDYKILSPQQLKFIENNTYIPNTGRMQPTRNVDAIRGQKFVAVYATERIIGPPISPQELQQIRRGQGVKHEQVLYQVTQPDIKQTTFIQHSPLIKNSIQPPAIEQSVNQGPAREKYAVHNFDNYGKRESEFKYNLFSVIDEPVNRCRQFGPNNCSCPSNEVIASKNRPQSLNWS